jgi:hypothetical protein
MPLVSIPILDTEYRFRKLTFREEFALIFPRGIDPCRVVLTAALVEVFRVGYTPFPVSDSATAGELLKPIPPTRPCMQSIRAAVEALIPHFRVEALKVTVVFPFAIATSICRNRFTTCSAVCFLPLAIHSSLDSFSITQTGTKNAGQTILNC